MLQILLASHNINNASDLIQDIDNYYAINKILRIPTGKAITNQDLKKVQSSKTSPDSSPNSKSRRVNPMLRAFSPKSDDIKKKFRRN